ncbi:uncharacterized protein LOC132720270 [Ruditapes philippinarum]|uniref:uncharacterized protein LOC132720270 n=1 Tax=Ruditapes philippinarum TaxID=129788 RepID=UPI00295BD358|nr:uncharacterized protein LOC132720270 [Ruditapes philippinarum]
MHAGDHLIPFAGKKKNTSFSVLVMVMLFLSNKGIVVNAAVPSESTMFSTDLLESQYCNMDNLYSLKKSCHTNVYSFAQLIFYCKFSDICNRDEKPYCISTSHFGAYVCLKKNLSCTKGRYYKAVADANSPKKIFFEEDNCPDGTYQPDESNCIHACGNKHRNLKNISEKYIVYSVGNSSHPTLVNCNYKLGYFNAKGILLLNYDENISDNICQQDGNVSSCPGQQYHLPNGTCVDKCDAGFERQLPDFVCTEIERLITRKDSGYQKVPDQGTNKDAVDQKAPFIVAGIIISVVSAVTLGLCLLVYKYRRHPNIVKEDDSLILEVVSTKIDKDGTNETETDVDAIPVYELCEKGQNNQNSENEDDDDNAETKLLQHHETYTHIAVISPVESKINDYKEIRHLETRLQQRTRESVQGAGDSEITQAKDQENNTHELQLREGVEKQTLSLKVLGTPESQIDWDTVFLKLSKSLSPTSWKFFAYHLLNGCQSLPRSVHDTVEEIEMETKNQHTSGWVIHAYLNVFYRWLKCLGRARASIEHIEEAVMACMEEQDAKDLVIEFKKSPPMKVSTSICNTLDPYTFDRTSFGRNASYPAQFMYMALCDDKTQDKAMTRKHVRSSESHIFEIAQFSSGPLDPTNEITNRQETFTTVQLNKTCKKPINRREKRKTKQSTIQENKKRLKNDNYNIRNALENMRLDIMPIRQNDYDIYMDFVINRILNECHVSKSIVLSVKYAGFCEPYKIETKDKETLYVLKSGRANICMGKEVYDDLDFYGNVARTKLLTDLKAKYTDYDETTSETYLFIRFDGKPLFEQEEEKVDNTENNMSEKVEGTEQQLQVNGKNYLSIRNSPDMKASEEHLNIRKKDFEAEKEDRSGPKIDQHDKKELRQSKEEREKNKTEGNRKQESHFTALDIEKELESIKESFFPTGDELYNLPTADDVAEAFKNMLGQCVRPPVYGGNSLPKIEPC